MCLWFRAGEENNLGCDGILWHVLRDDNASAEGHGGAASAERCERKSTGASLYSVSSVMALMASIATGELTNFGPRIPFYSSAGLAASAAVLVAAARRERAGVDTHPEPALRANWTSQQDALAGTPNAARWAKGEAARAST